MGQLLFRGVVISARQDAISWTSANIAAKLGRDAETRLSRF
jgi:hypothetical protein